MDVLFLAWVIVFAIPASGTVLLVSWDMRRRRAVCSTATTSWIHGLAIVQAWSPSIVLGSFATLVAIAWISVGARPTLPTYDFSREPMFSHWIGGPHPSVYDPWRAIVGFSGLVTILGIVFAPAWFALARSAGRAVGGAAKCAYFAGWSATVGLLTLDPLGLVMWAFGD